MTQADFLRFAIDALEFLKIPYALVGSYASGAYGEPRFTQDIDILIALQRDQVSPLCAAFPADEFYVSDQAAQEAIAYGSQFNVIHPASGNKVDFLVVGASDWKSKQLERRRQLDLLPDRHVFLAAPEDVILGKLVYYNEGGSEKHLRDITGILRISGKLVDRAYVAEFARRLGVLEIWNAVLRRIGEPVDEPPGGK